MEDRIQASDSVVAHLSDWNWTSRHSAALSADLVRAVSRAERVAGPTEFDVGTELAEGRRERLEAWHDAYVLAEELRRREPAPHPTIVEEALARVDAAASRLGLRAS